MEHIRCFIKYVEKQAKLMTAMIYYTITGLLLYVLSDWILQKMEVAAGRRFEYRSFIFFFILLFLALVCFSAIRLLSENQ